LLSSSAEKTIIVNSGDLTFTGGNATANGPTAVATALAGTDAGNLTTIATALTVKTLNGRMILNGGTQAGTGFPNASAQFLSTGHIELSAVNFGAFALTLNGALTSPTGHGSGLFQNFSGSGAQPTSAAGPFIFVNGGYCLPSNPACGVIPNIGLAFVLSGAPPSNLDPFQAALLAALATITGKALPTSTASSSSAAKANYCK
jgi:hypothetical protein